MTTNTTPATYCPATVMDQLAELGAPDNAISELLDAIDGGSRTSDDGLVVCHVGPECEPVQLPAGCTVYVRRGWVVAVAPAGDDDLVVVREADQQAAPAGDLGALMDAATEVLESCPVRQARLEREAGEATEGGTIVRQQLQAQHDRLVQLAQRMTDPGKLAPSAVQAALVDYGHACWLHGIASSTESFDDFRAMRDAVDQLERKLAR